MPAVPEHRKYWFAAKRYGYGWGLPLCWQGWVVYALFLGGLVADSLIFSPARRMGRFQLGVLLLAAALVAVCLRKGEPARWRWGNGPGRD